jgi:hypothetical protein
MNRGSRRAVFRYAGGAAAAGIGLLALACAGCGGGRPSEKQAAPFRVAIEGYLQDENMGMKPETFESLAIDGDTAAAEVRMAATDVAYGMRPRWAFTFRRKGDAWTVIAVKR